VIAGLSLQNEAGILYSRRFRPTHGH
jgi:hypothetical protein